MSTPASDPPWRGRWLLRAGARPGLVPMVLAAGLMIGLLLTFHGVVRGAVLRGELRRAAFAAHELALWRCTTLRTVPLRDACRAALDAAPAAPIGR